jgi:GNAT superfamily N-acetyltransferase
MITFIHNIPVQNTMRFESCYPKPLRYTLEEKEAMSQDPNIAFIYIVDKETKKAIAEAILGDIKYVLDEADGQDMGISEFRSYKSVYLFKFTILPEYQRKGYGKILQAYIMGYLRDSGYTVIVGHANNANMTLQEFYGAVKVARFEPWFGVPEEYWLYYINL